MRIAVEVLGFNHREIKNILLVYAQKTDHLLVNMSHAHAVLFADTATAGVELEQNVCGLGDGTRNGQRLFPCAPGRALFVPLALCRRDARFRDTPPPERLSHNEEHFDQVTLTDVYIS